MDQCKYQVVFDDFTKRHFVKHFEKKYKDMWLHTKDDIIFLCEHIDNLLLGKRADLISAVNNYRLVKLDFAIYGVKVSPKASGNRCILLVDNQKKVVRVLLVYSKNDISAKGETKEWKKIIKNNYKDVGKIFNL